MLKHALPFFPILVILIFTACTATPQPNGISPESVTSFVQSMTATTWTLTPSSTPEPNTSKIVDTLNSVIIDSDPLSETVEAKFDVLDVRFPLDPTSKQVLRERFISHVATIFSMRRTLAI